MQMMLLGINYRHILLACMLRCWGNLDKAARRDADESLHGLEAEKHECALEVGRLRVISVDVAQTIHAV
jgi:hypothetical protein